MSFNLNGNGRFFYSAAPPEKRLNLKMSFGTFLYYGTHGEERRAEHRRLEEVNPAANVKTVARLKSMGDGGSWKVGSVMAVVTQRRGGVGSLLYAKASGASRRPYR